MINGKPGQGTHSTKICAEKLDKISKCNKIVCPIKKICNSYEKRLHLASVIRVWWLQWKQRRQRDFIFHCRIAKLTLFSTGVLGPGGLFYLLVSFGEDFFFQLNSYKNGPIFLFVKVDKNQLVEACKTCPLVALKICIYLVLKDRLK